MRHSAAAPTRGDVFGAGAEGNWPLDSTEPRKDSKRGGVSRQIKTEKKSCKLS